MAEAGVPHSHPGRGVHSHVTALAPPVIELFQQIEDFAASLPPDAASALRRLLRAGLVAEAREHDGSVAEVVGYQHDWYRAFIATQHEHPAAAPLTDPYLYRPPWWPAPAIRRRTPPPVGQ